MTTDLKELALAAKAATAAYIADPTDRETRRQWDRACAEFSLACTEDAILALIRERDEAIKSSDAVCDSYAEENQRLFDRAETAEAALSSYKEEVERLRRVLAEARDDMQAWQSYASDYFRDKHDADGDLAKIDQALTKETPHAE